MGLVHSSKLSGCAEPLLQASRALRSTPRVDNEFDLCCDKYCSSPDELSTVHFRLYRRLREREYAHFSAFSEIYRIYLLLILQHFCSAEIFSTSLHQGRALFVHLL